MFPDAVLACRQPPQFCGAWHFATSEDPYLYNPRHWVFSPRIGAAFRIDSRSALRASWSRFITPVVTLTDTQCTMDIYGFNIRTNALPAVEGRPQAWLSNPFPSSVNPLIMPKGKALGRCQNLGDNAVWSNQDFERPQSDRLSLSYQRELPSRIVVDGTFFFNWIRGLYDRNANQADPNLSLTYKAALSKNVSNPFYLYGTPDTFPGQLRNRSTVSIASLLTPHPQYLSLTQRNTEGMRNQFRSWQVRARRPFASGYMFLFSCNYNRERYYEFWDSIAEYAQQFEWRESPEPRHRLSLSGTVDLPFGKGRKFLPAMHPLFEGVLGGWLLSGIYTWNNGSLLTFGQIKVLQDISPKLPNPTLDRYFDTSIFAIAEPYTRRTNPKKYEDLRGPSRWNLDATVAKKCALSEKWKLEFRLEDYNLKNSIMYNNPNTSVSSSLFGRITGQANRGREVQYCARILF